MVHAARKQDVAQNPYLLVTHQRPDTDALCCLWAADRFIVPEDADRQFAFIESSTQLDPELAKGCEVMYMDVGGGPFDQHGKRLNRGSSFQLLMEHDVIKSNPLLRLSLAPILELTRATDNVEFVSPTSIHYVLKGLPFACRKQGQTEIDWLAVIDNAFFVLDIIHGQQRLRVESREKYRKFGRTRKLPNGLKVATVWGNPGLREAAYEDGADVVMWTQNRGKSNFEVGIQVGRNSKAKLIPVIAAIRRAEAQKRGITITEQEASSILTLASLPGWFLHDSEKLILSGSRSHRLQGDEFTRLSPHEILTALCDGLNALRL